MATTQTHHDIRHALSLGVAALITERASVAPAYSRYQSIGTPSVGDGGAAATAEFKVAVDALSEVLSDAVGDGDFGGINPVIGPLPASTVGAPLNANTGELTFKVANLLPFPALKLRPVGGGADVSIAAFIKSITFAKATNPFTGANGTLSVATVIVTGVSSALSGGYRLVVQNPLDTRSTEVVSSGVIYLTAP